MMKYLTILLMMVSPAFGQIAQDSESDTLTLLEARTELRYLLNDYSSATTWPDSVLNGFLNESLWEIAATGVVEKCDTIVTSANTIYYTLNTDFMYELKYMVKSDARWLVLDWGDSTNKIVEKRDTIVTADSTIYYVLNEDFGYMLKYLVKNDDRWVVIDGNDSAGMSMVIKQDTIITTANTPMYDLNDDFVGELGIIIKRDTRWSGLYPKLLKGEGSFGTDANKENIQSYSIADKKLFIDPPLAVGSDTLIVVYVSAVSRCFVSDKRFVVNAPVTGDSIIVFYASLSSEYYVSDKKLVINAPMASDSIIIFYAAYANDLSADAAIINIPYEYRTQLLQGAVKRARLSNRER